MSVSASSPMVDPPSQKQLIFTMSGQCRSAIVINKMRELHPNDERVDFRVFNTTEELHEVLSEYPSLERRIALFDEMDKKFMTHKDGSPSWALGTRWSVAIHEAIEGIEVRRGGKRNRGEAFARRAINTAAKQLYADFVTNYKTWRAKKLETGRIVVQDSSRRPTRVAMAWGIGARGN